MAPGVKPRGVGRGAERVGRQVLEALGSFWKEFSANSNEDFQGGSEPGKATAVPAGVPWAVLAGVHAGPPPPPNPCPAQHITVWAKYDHHPHCRKWEREAQRS